MKRILLLFLITTSLFSQKQKLLDIQGHSFLLFEEDYDEYDSKGKTVTFYNGEDSNRTEALLSFVLNDVTGGCNDKSIEKGVYELSGSTIIFYTLWQRVGSIDDAPFGGRVKSYEISKNGEIKLLSSYLYIEEHTKESNSGSGMRFLFESPKREEDKSLFLTYISLIEKRYGGEFVFDKKSSKLIIAVREALKRQVKAVWKSR